MIRFLNSNIRIRVVEEIKFLKPELLFFSRKTETGNIKSINFIFYMLVFYVYFKVVSLIII